MADDPMDDRTQYDKSVELLCKHGKYPKDCMDCGQNEVMAALDRRQYDPPLECETCPTCGAQLTSGLECYRCDREKMDKQHGHVTIDESNRAKRGW